MKRFIKFLLKIIIPPAIRQKIRFLLNLESYLEGKMSEIQKIFNDIRFNDIKPEISDVKQEIKRIQNILSIGKPSALSVVSDCKLQIISRPYIQPKNTFKHLITTAGTGHSGSGTIVDFLTEFNNCTVIGYHSPNGGGKLSHTLDKKNNYEIEIMGRSGGILELEEVIENNNIFIKDAAIKRFIDMYEYNYSQLGGFYNDEYLRLSREFVDNLTEIKNRVNTPAFNFHLMYPHDYYDNLEHPFALAPGKTYNTYFLKKMTRTEYRAIAKQYLHKILSTIEAKDYLLLDHFLNDRNSNMEAKLDYFDDIKVVGVYRDPRDVFATGILLQAHWIPHTPDEFIKWWNKVQWITQIRHPKCLIIRFEEFVLNYDLVAPLVMRFLGLEEENHIHKQGFFDPDISRKNIGLYKTITEQDALRQIEKDLGEFIYKGIEN